MDARQLVSQHPDVVAQQGYALVGAVVPAVEALRSQTARNALILLQVAATWGVAGVLSASSMGSRSW